LSIEEIKNGQHNFDQRPEIETRQEATNHGGRDACKTGLIDVHHHIVPPFIYPSVATALSRRAAVELIPLI